MTGRPGNVDVLLVGALFLLPQLTLISVGSGSIRVDDAILVLLLLRNLRYLSEVPGWLAGRIALVGGAVLLALTAAVLAHRVGPVSGLLYSVRPFEYMTGLLVGIGVARRGATDSLSTAFRLVALELALLSVLQTSGVEIGVSQASYTRAAGNVGGPYELAGLTAILALWFLSRRDSLGVVASLLSLVLSASRISIVALFLIVLVAGRSILSARAKVLVAVVGVLLVPLATVLQGGQSSDGQSNSFVARLASTHAAASWHLGCQYADSYAPADTTDAYYDLGYPNLLVGTPELSQQGDASSQIRFSRWCLLLRGWSDDTGTELLGLGPSFAGAAVDGQYVRYLIEFGLVGLLAWGYLWFSVARRLKGLAAYAVISMAAGAVFIDLFTSSRPTFLLWIVMGCAVASSARAQDPSGAYPAVDSASPGG